MVDDNLDWINWDETDVNLIVPLYERGTLVVIDLTKHLLLDSEEPEVDPEKWIQPYYYIAELGEKPVAFVLKSEPLDVYCQILLLDKKFWFPTRYMTKL